MKIITRTIWVLSFVSFFTDVASEMLYPVMPVYLRSVGFSVILIGILEGFAEATAGLSKGYFGNLSDNIGKRLPFVRMGYALSALSKPMLAIFVYPLWIFFSRAIDRLGKGVRTAARDAILSDEATKETKGTVFGFHRAMDTFGAVLGPTLALLYLWYHPNEYKPLFLIAFLPGVLAISLTFLLKEKQTKPADVPGKKTRLLDFVRYWKTSTPTYRKLVGALLIFTLFNSSDVFLLLKIKESGANDTIVIGAYIFYNIVYALFSYPLGKMADRIGMRKVLVGGLLLFAGVYASFAFAENNILFFGLFFLYGVYAAATEGVAKAWITNVCEKNNTATAIGTYTAFQSIATLLASSLAGLIWFSFSATATFLLSGMVALAVAAYISRIRE